MKKKKCKFNQEEDITIGASKYGVYLADMPDNLGLINVSDCKILLDPHQSPEKMRVTLMHEIIHGIIEEFTVLKHMGLSENAEHHITDALSVGVVKTMVDNKRLFQKWLKSM